METMDTGTQPPPMRAWCNGYEVIAARTAEEAEAHLRSLGLYADDDEIEGDGWSALKDDAVVGDEDGSPAEPRKTVGDRVRAAGDGPKHLWSWAV